MDILSRRQPEYQPLGQDDDSSEPSDIEMTAYKHMHRRSRSLSSLSSFLPLKLSAPARWLRFLRRIFLGLALLCLVLVLLTPIVNPSYSRRPPHYTGRNVNNEKVFIAANIVDEELIRGAWGKRILELLELLGEDNVFLSIYENDSGPGTRTALKELGKKAKSKSSVVSGHIDLDTFPSIQILPNERRVKRIAYLAEVRNKAIEPLLKNTTGIKFDKLLFINDVIFSPSDAADLLFATNVGPDGKSRYHAACAMDFINAFKFYDTFASRDAEGHSLGVPFFPWFTGAGKAISRSDVLSGTDAVRVKSCWGGMVAFEAKWFEEQAKPQNTLSGDDDEEDDSTTALQTDTQVRFRSSPELFWDASECCLIHADIAALASLAPEEWENHSEFDTGIYMNPYIRVAYDAHSHSWLEFTRRFERVYTWAHGIVNHVAGRPPFQPRRTAEPGKMVEHREWVYDGPEGYATNKDTKAKVLTPKEITREVQRYGHWETFERTALPGGFCGNRQLLVLKKLPWVPGEKIWEKLVPPPGANDKP